MMRRGVLVAAVGGVALALATAAALNQAGEFKRLAFRAHEQCVPVPGVPGPEDLAVDDARGVVFISSLDRRAIGAQGAIYRYSFADGVPRIAALDIRLAGDFRPHGLSLYHDADGRTYLFVVNHRAAGDAVEVFSYETDRLVHQASFSDARIQNGNAVLAVGKKQFYLTLDHRWTSPIGQRFEEYLGLKTGAVAYFDGDGFRYAAERIAFANGINRSRDGNSVYVASMLGRKILVYDRDASSGALRLRREIVLESAPDNIQVTADGDLLVGAHPKLLTLSRHRGDRERRAPSQILRITSADGAAPRIEELYLDDGTQISGASVGALYRDRLVIGAIYDRAFVICRI